MLIRRARTQRGCPPQKESPLSLAAAGDFKRDIGSETDSSIVAHLPCSPLLKFYPDLGKWVQANCKDPKTGKPLRPQHAVRLAVFIEKVAYWCRTHGKPMIASTKFLMGLFGLSTSDWHGVVHFLAIAKACHLLKHTGGGDGKGVCYSFTIASGVAGRIINSMENKATRYCDITEAVRCIRGFPEAVVFSLLSSGRCSTQAEVVKWTWLSPAYVRNAVRKLRKENLMLATPKIGRVRSETIETISAVVNATKEKKAEIVAIRLASVSSGLTIPGLQELLNKAMKDYLPTLPRVVVTQKPFNVFRKRVIEAKIDVAKFIDFSIRSWTTLSSQSQRAYLRCQGNRKGTPLPEAPTFSSFAYRLPYFLAAYANVLTRGGALGKNQDPYEAEIARLKAQLATSKQETAEARDLLRGERVRSRERYDVVHGGNFHSLPCLTHPLRKRLTLPSLRIYRRGTTCRATHRTRLPR